MRNRWWLVLPVPMIVLGLAWAFVGNRAPAVPNQTGEAVYSRDGQLYRLSIDGGSETRMTNLSAGSGAKSPVWSPDGQYVVFSMLLPTERGALSSSDLYRVNRDGTQLSRLHAHRIPGEQLDSPAFLPDGNSIVFSRFAPLSGPNRDSDDELQIVEAGLTNNDVTVLAKDGTMPAVSLDGKFLTYVRVAPESFAQSLWLLDLATGSQRVLIPEDDFATIYWPHFSPTGAEIAFSGATVKLMSGSTKKAPGLALGLPLPFPAPALHGEPSDLYKIEVATGKTSLVATLGEDDPAPLWSADGRRILVIGTAALYSVDAGGQKVDLLHKPGGYGGGDWRGK